MQNSPYMYLQKLQYFHYEIQHNLNLKRTARHTQSYLTPKHAFNIVIKILIFSNSKTKLKVREKRVSFP